MILPLQVKLTTLRRHRWDEVFQWKRTTKEWSQKLRYFAQVGQLRKLKTFHSKTIGLQNLTSKNQLSPINLQKSQSRK